MHSSRHTLWGRLVVVSQFQQISAHAAVVNRLGELWEVLGPVGDRAARNPVAAPPKNLSV